LEGEFGLNDVFVGVPVKLGKNGIEKIININLTADEQALLVESAASVKEIMDVVDGMNIL
jgi:malate dehydrogenase